MSAMINVDDPDSWRLPFGHYPTLMQLLDDLLLMRKSVLLHPCCRSFAAALAADAVPQRRAISLCLGQLDDVALAAAASALRAAGCTPGPTINDSLLVLRRSPFDPPTTLRTATAAATRALEYPISFSFLPRLTKASDPPPTLASLAAALCEPAPVTSPASSSPPPSPAHSPGASPSSTPTPPRSPSPLTPSDEPSLSDSLPVRSPSFSPSYSRSPSPGLNPLDDPADGAHPLAQHPAPPASPLLLPPASPLRPIGLSGDDPTLQRMIGFNRRGTTRLGYFGTPIPHLLRPRDLPLQQTDRQTDRQTVLHCE